MARVIVTGGSGKVGRACIDDLLAHGYEVVNLDLAPPKKEQNCPFIQIDLTDFGQVIDAFSGVDDRYSQVDAVVHLAAIPAPGIKPDHVIFANNVVSTYNVFQAARKLGIRDVVWASSETVLGLPFEVPPPYVPVDEEYPGRPESAYSLGKLVDETIAQQFCRWDEDQKIIGLRFSNVMEPEDYARFPSFDSDAKLRKWNLWAYIDARDAAQAIRKALELPTRGYDVFIIANADSVMSRPNAELMAEIFPDVSFQRDVEPNETLLSIEKARRILGYEPEYSWRKEGLRDA